MGMMMSFMGKGMPLPSTQVFNVLTGTLYNQFIEKDIKDFEEFHAAILDMFNIINSALPGKHYDAPSREQVEENFEKWKQCTCSERKVLFENFMKETVTLSKLDNYTVMAGMVTPPAAMAVKKAGENVPQINIIKAIPDVIFVPSVTVLAIITAKISRNIIQGKLRSSATSA